jgi:tetratricopeptide (TPR) repeat protein
VKTRAALVALILGLGTFILFLPVRNHEFLNWDDLTYLSNNDHVKGGITWEGVKWAFTHSYSANWHPLTWLSHALDCQLYGLRPAGHHLTNVLFHSLNSALLFLLLLKLTGRFWPSAFVAGLFAVHPLHVESVAWVAERKDVLSTFCFLLMLMTYQRYVKATKVLSEPRSSRREEAQIKTAPARGVSLLTSAPTETRSSAFWYGAALVLFALGLMSKPMLVTAPFVLLLLDYWPLGRFAMDSAAFRKNAFALVREKIPFFAFTVGSCVITFLAQKKSGAVASFEQLSLATRLANALVAYTQYLAKFFWPANLSPFYRHPEHWSQGHVAAAVAILGAITVAAWMGRRRFPYALMGWLWFLGTLIPVIGIVQVGSQALADRYTYIPLLGVMIAVTWLVGDLAVGNRSLQSTSSQPKGARKTTSRIGSPAGKSTGFLMAATSVLIVFVLAWRTSAQLIFWRNTETLFNRALEQAPNSVQALYGLGTSLIDAGRVDEGLPMVKKAIELQPRYPEALGTLANTLDSQGKYEDALHFYEVALRAQPDHAGVLNNLAWFRATCPNPAFRNGAEAVRMGTQACELTGYNTPLFIGTLAAAQAEAGDFQAAIATGERAASVATSLRLRELAAKNRDLVELYRQGKTVAGTK